jgi:hypothetical protein
VKKKKTKNKKMPIQRRYGGRWLWAVMGVTGNLLRVLCACGLIGMWKKDGVVDVRKKLFL